MAKYFCLYCGSQASTVSSLTSGYCTRHPDGSGLHHVLYEGGEKSQYTCKYCGTSAPSISSMTCGYCPRNQNGRGHHVPAL